MVVVGQLEDVLPAEGVTLGGGLHLVYPSSGQVPRKVTAFRDLLIDWLKRSPLA